MGLVNNTREMKTYNTDRIMGHVNNPRKTVNSHRKTACNSDMTMGRVNNLREIQTCINDTVKGDVNNPRKTQPPTMIVLQGVKTT